MHLNSNYLSWSLDHTKCKNNMGCLKQSNKKTKIQKKQQNIQATSMKYVNKMDGFDHLLARVRMFRGSRNSGSHSGHVDGGGFGLFLGVQGEVTKCQHNCKSANGHPRGAKRQFAPLVEHPLRVRPRRRHLWRRVHLRPLHIAWTHLFSFGFSTVFLSLRLFVHACVLG